jgi:hypothetical protein
VVERRRPLNTRRERREIPQVPKSPQDRCSTVRHSLATAVNTKLLNVSRGNPRRDDPGRQTASKTIKLEGILVLVRGSDGVSKVIRARRKRRRDVVMETSSLIESDDEEGVLPLRSVADGIVHLLEEDFSIRDETGRVHGVSANTAARGVDVGELREAAEVGVLVELVEALHVLLGVAAGNGGGEVHGVAAAGDGGVVLPGDVLGGELLEDGVLG